MAADDPLASLEAEYCPPLDSALLSAIVSDYDLTSEPGLSSARATLDALKESALLEEAADFDPSGTGGEDLEVWDETGASRSRETDATSVSNGAESEGDVGGAEDLEALDEDAKVALLREMFGERLGAYHVLHTLRKCGGRWNGAVEELLNHVYFGEVGDGQEGEGVKAKGVEGFAEDNHIVKRGRKTKAKGQKMRAMEERRAASMPVSPSAEGNAQTGNKWLTAKEDVDFIASRTGIEIFTVKSTYNEHGANVPKTINALLKQTMEETKKVVTDDALVQSHARELGHAFPSLAPHYLTALIRLTHPSTSSAHDLAAALVAKPPPQTGLQVIPIYARPTASDLDPTDSDPSPRAPRSANPSLARAPDDPTVALRGQSYAAARAQAFAQASAAHRRAGSDRLMGGAAAYYSQLGRELTALSAGATADAADALAERQSGAAVLDLHGIDVLNGVRIAVERVEGWWEGLGERRVNGRGGAEERGEGFRVVVGAGRHSEGGKGKLGPAVTKALRARGWRVEGAGAVLVVKGKARR